jgi:hypothetical protein
LVKNHREGTKSAKVREEENIYFVSSRTFALFAPSR